MSSQRDIEQTNSKPDLVIENLAGLFTVTERYSLFNKNSCLFYIDSYFLGEAHVNISPEENHTAAKQAKDNIYFPANYSQPSVRAGHFHQ